MKTKREINFRYSWIIIFVMYIFPVHYSCTQIDVHKDWRLALQAYTFKEYTFFEAIEKASSLGLKWIECGRGLLLSEDYPGVRTDYLMLTPELRNKLKEKLKEENVTLVDYGVVKLPNNEPECRKAFDFAKEMGIETILAEPEEDAFDLLDKLCEEYKINIAIHNHAKPTTYWNPDKVLELIKNKSKRIGVYADTGHWMRSGVDVMEALKKCEGRIIGLHLKDLNEFGVREAHDMPWGTGMGNIRGILEELYRQKFKGVIAIEYEYNWDNNYPDVEKCINYYNEVIDEL